MKVLLDTHTFLWIIADSPKLSAGAKSVYLKKTTEAWLSMASLWEMAIKISLDKLRIDGDFDQFIGEQIQVQGVRSFDILFSHVGRVASLPFHHRDPFDRLLVAQCLEAQIPIVSGDPIFDRYGVKRIW